MNAVSFFCTAWEVPHSEHLQIVIVAVLIVAVAFAMFLTAALDYRKKKREFKRLMAQLNDMKSDELLLRAPRFFKEIISMEITK